MATVPEADIVVRTLINVLDPSLEQRDVCLRAQRARYKSRRFGVRQCDEPEVLARTEPLSSIAVTECLSLSMISVSWSDSCSGRYTEQIWCRSRARVPSVCVLTGRAIRRGDPVFRPRASDICLPSNRQRMILAATVQPCDGGSAPDTI
ncbi:hypothetical protein CFB46_31550 [Burkholderia sp. HI2761]|uniref:DUF3331 domain-containing protein n=1 Tax=Burkholderia TaxID=32008 RepID=UPI0009B88851|nr:MULTISPECIES: DUF3331 domain-containing protein [Burkholderia]MPV57373.1 DUF3331 domain-containing protein [Burkholderia sp. BE24]OXJ22348.1 hypothetical protein CFB46_31550 [Burkholderia sp. HI2761]